MPKNWFFWTVLLEKTLESPLDCKEIQPVLPKGNQSWVFIGTTDAETETPILWPPDSLEKTLLLGKMKVGGEGDDRGWNDWMASLSQWTWVWVNSGSWWWIGRPGVLQFMGSQRVGHDWATELNCTAGRYDKEQNLYFFCKELDLIAFPISHGRGRSQKEREELEVCL